jgi:Glycosyltransferase family 87
MAATEQLLRSPRKREPPSLLVVVLWIVAAAFTVGAIWIRYVPAHRMSPADDFLSFLQAARNVASDVSPYTNNPKYVYPPFLGFLGAPFSHISTIDIWKAWIGIILVAPLVGVVAFIAIQAKRIRPAAKPIIFILCSLTLYVHYWPMYRELIFGQSDTVTFPLIVLAALAASRNRPVWNGLWLGLAGLMKLWPAAIGLSLLQVGRRRRWPAIGSFVGSMALAPILAVAVGGASGLGAFYTHLVDADKQHLVNDSVWGAPELLFSKTGLARPVLVSHGLRELVALLLALWVVGLLVIAIRTAGDPVVCTFNVTFCVILLLPIAHRQYAIYALPLVWLWVLRLWQVPAIRGRDLAVAGVMAGWWLVAQEISWPYNGSAPSISAIQYCVPLIADVIACTVSVLAATRKFSRPDPSDIDPDIVSDQVGLSTT